jgi:hypothetical protein
VNEAEFQEQMKSRMRACMGDVLTDDALAEVVARGIEGAFFEPRVRHTPGGPAERLPSWLEEFVGEECRARVQKAVEEWVKENSILFTRIIREVIGAGMATAAIRAFNALMEVPMLRLEKDVAFTVAALRDKGVAPPGGQVL